MHVRQVPHEVRLDDVRLRVVVAEQLVGLGLIRPDRERAVGVVLQARRRVLAVVKADRVVEAERQAVAEPALQRQLQRVIRAPLPARGLGDRAVALDSARIRSADHRRRARRRAGRQRRILVLRQERRAEVDAVDVAVFCRMSYWCWPTYDTSSVIAHGSAICDPPFHWTDDGRSLSYSNTLSAGGDCVVRPPVPSVCSCA